MRHGKLSKRSGRRAPKPYRYRLVASEQEVQSMFRIFHDAFGHIDILVANPGIQMDAAASNMTLEQWRRVIDVNLTGQFLCAREAIRCFSEQEASPYSRPSARSSA